MQPDPWDSMPSAVRTTARTDSEEALQTALEWIEECVEAHDYCQSPDKPTLPTRVIDVGLNDGVIKLVETHGKKARYVCLSHCWGLVPIITTTRATLNDRKKAISSQELSNTFRDAILLTRRLGVDFIWIDSLCIVQDDLEDWEIESANMASIYNNSYLTIAATKSRDGSGGFYSDTPDFEVFGTTPEGEPYLLFFRERIDHHIDVIGDHDETDGVEIDSNENYDRPTSVYYPLLTRAWVYQERMLSTRVLHFGRYELFFECNSNLACECESIQYYGSSGAATVPRIKIEHGDILDADNVTSHENYQYEIARLWRTMVSSYTALLLTKASDRLPAMGGLAKHMATRRKVDCRYLAGLWENSLSDDLLWVVHTTTIFKKPRPHPRTAPTWSWASLDTYVLYWDELLYGGGEGHTEQARMSCDHFSTVESCTVTPGAIDEFGTLAGGKLRITGLLAACVLEREAKTHEGRDDIVHYVSFSPSERFPIKTDYLLDHDGPDRVSPGMKVYCLQMSRVQAGPTDRLVSLVLRPVDGEPGLFERIASLIVTIKNKTLPDDLVWDLYASSRSETVVIV